MFDGTQYNSEYLQVVIDEIARREFLEFVKETKSDYETNWHHLLGAEKLQKFADGEIKHLMMFWPPQTGKSELATRRLPAYLLGRYPDKRVGVTSYSHPRAAQFNRDIQRIITSDEYRRIFPDTRLSESNVVTVADGTYLRNSEMFEIVKRKGFLVATGIGGLLNGISLDYLIMDDTVKNRQDAMSLAKQRFNNDWWDSVAKVRMDNDGQVLIVNTRWDEDDLAGYILKAQEFDFEVLVLPSLKVDGNDPNDPREIGEALWENKHSRKRLEARKAANPVVFEAIEQQNPGTPTEVLVYSKQWKQIEEMPGYSEFWGLDFGFSSPSALSRCMIKGNNAYIEEKLYKYGLDIDELALELKAAGVRGNVVYCDSAEPATIKGLRKRGISAIKSDKSLIAGILYMQSLDVHYAKSSTNLALEKKKYQFPCGPNNLPIPGADPIDAYNHLMDAARYAFYTKASKPVPSFDIV